MIGAIILAAGNGSRYGGYKQFEKVNGKQVLDYTIDIYKDIADKMVIVLPQGYSNRLYLNAVGGKTSFESICIGFEFVKDCKKILIVDAVRCNTSEKMIQGLLDGLEEYDYMFPALPVKQDCCEIGKTDIWSIYSKDNMHELQTPTVFKSDLLKTVIDTAFGRDDFSTMVHAANVLTEAKMGFVDGEPENIKITYRQDIELFKILLKEKVRDASRV